MGHFELIEVTLHKLNTILKIDSDKLFSSNKSYELYSD